MEAMRIVIIFVLFIYRLKMALAFDERIPDSLGIQ
jgi:hypothetical protein